MLIPGLAATLILVLLQVSGDAPWEHLNAQNILSYPSSVRAALLFLSNQG